MRFMSFFAGMAVSFAIVAAQVVAAQDAPTQDAPKRTIRPGLTIGANDWGGVYIERTAASDAGQWAELAPYVVTDAGVVRLTACDELFIPCNPVVIRMEGVSQGEGFALGPLR